MEDLKEYLEEIAAFKRICLLKYKSELGAVITSKVKIVDFYNEDGAFFLLTDSGNRINVASVIDADNIISNSMS
jgi:hypothetical protein